MANVGTTTTKKSLILNQNLKKENSLHWEKTRFFRRFLRRYAEHDGSDKKSGFENRKNGREIQPADELRYEREKTNKQAGTELGQAQLKLGLGFTSTIVS